MNKIQLISLITALTSVADAGFEDEVIVARMRFTDGGLYRLEPAR